ncbi:MAG: hypothetical protein DI536_09905 [Archangium gephyra]|uniref:Uncharacterized protein n=1 Tax=Archangium gephyra TaxID=48 RepID=A0A2W5TFR2_9BACT|nr:MAG: hypothetical protein DI536_09905 [Archangium gephyra]
MGAAGCAPEVPSQVQSGFKMAEHSMPFANFAAGFDASEMDAELMQRMFGDVVCENAASPCQLTPGARAFASKANKSMTGGRCEGFAVMSSLFHGQKLNPVDFGAPLARELRAAAMAPAKTPEAAAIARQGILHLGMLSGTRPGQRDVLDEAQGLVQQLTSTARTVDDYSVLCGTVGNMAELSMLPQIETWSRLPDPALRQQVPQALRRYRVDRVHGLVVEWLQRETDAGVKRELFNVLHHMYTDAAQPIDAPLVAEALRHLRENPMVLTRQSLYHLLAPHMANPEVHAAFKQALRYELDQKSGLYSLVAQDLPPDSVLEVLSTMPSLARQFGGALKPIDERPAAPPASTPLPDLPAPAGMDEALRGAK